MTSSLKHLVTAGTSRAQVTMSASQKKPLKRLAVLDDYAGIAPKHFENINGIKTSYWDQTLDAAKEDDLEALVRRLEPYGALSLLSPATRTIH